VIPAHKAVKSVFNITREHAWRPLWEKDLGNIQFEYKAGKSSDVRAWAQSPKLAQAGPQKPSQALAVTRLWRAYGSGFSL